MSTDRGIVSLNQNGPLMRTYNFWRDKKGWAKTQRSQIDLCHFMRVVMIFAPWRFFWQGSSLTGYFPPFLAILFVSIASFGLTEIVVNWDTHVFDHVITWTGVGLGIGIVAAAIILGIVYMITHHFQKAAHRFCEISLTVLYWATCPLWGPALWFWKLLKLGYVKTLVPFGNWFVYKQLFSFSIKDELITPTPGGIFLMIISLASLVGLLALYVNAWLVSLLWTGVGTAIFFSIIGIVGVVIYQYNHPVIRTVEATQPPKPKKDHETARVFWQFIVAKKHRICPLIQVKP